MRTGIAVCIVLALLGAAAWLLRTPGPSGSETETAAKPSVTAAPGPDPAPASAPAAEPPRSLRDSEIDGALALDPDGHFAPTREALALFDYFLSATGEEPLEQLRARIEAEIARRLPPAAAREAQAFLARYLAYREAAARVTDDERIAASADLERRLQWLRELRRAHFGAELAATLFGDEERAVEIAIEQRRVASDPALSADERRARLAALEQSLPDSARTAREQAALPARLAEEEQALRDSGASDAEIRALRERTVGPEAAARLAALDERRAAWTRRLDAYRAERDAVVADGSLDPAAREAALERLRSRDFDARERLRVRTIDEVEIGAPPSGAAPP